MDTNKLQHRRRWVTPKTRELLHLSDGLRDGAVDVVNRLYDRKSRAYQPFMSSSKVTRWRSSGGAFADLLTALAPLPPESREHARAWVNAAIDALQADADEQCIRELVMAGVEANAADEIASARFLVLNDPSHLIAPKLTDIARDQRIIALAMAAGRARVA